MRPVRPGDRGPAVEDIQRRLLVLGFDLGRTGVDGVFLGKTAEAVSAFQSTNRLSEDGVVGPLTWSALVDATFRLGDRALYLRLPHLHGADVVLLQGALNALGFACGEPDGIFGAFTERAVREFQRNSGLPADGIFGPESVSALMNLRHAWDGKAAASHSGARTAPARAAAVLASVSLALTGSDEPGSRVARRVVNLAHATVESALAEYVAEGEQVPIGVRLVVHIGTRAPLRRHGTPVVASRPVETLAARIGTALASRTGCGHISVDLSAERLDSEREEQRCAVALLDALCEAFDHPGSPW